MDQNGFNNNNFFEGNVFIDGDTDIDGNLTVSGTYPSGGGGSVNNPMTSNLDANNYAIFNISELTAGEEGYIRTGPLDLQDNDIININEIKGNSAENILYISANVEMLEDLNMTNKSIINLSQLTAGDTGIISIIGVVDFKDHNIIGVDTLSIDRITTNDPSITNIECDNKSLVDLNSIQTQGISSSTGATAFTSILNMFNDINMNYNDIFNVDRITTSQAGVSINLDLVPATEGKAGQVLARDPAFVPGNFATHKLVWQTPSGGGGGITNPLTANLEGAGYSIFDTNTIECKDINIMASGAGIGSNNGSFAVPITWGLAKKASLAPFYQTFNTDYITPATNLGLTIDSKAPDGITDSKITLSAPNIILNNSTNIAPSLVTITGDIQITNGSGYIHGNNLIVRGRTAGNTPTNLTLEGITTSINSTTLSINSNLNTIVGNTNFTATVRTNTIDANSGSNISVLENLTLAVNKQLKSSFIFTDAIRSNTDTTLYIAGLLPDNKTQTNIIVASPLISFNNQFGPLITDTQVNISGSLVFNNPVSTPFIQGSNLIIRGRTPANIATQLTIEGTTTTINSSTLNISSSLANNIGGQTNFDKNINLLSLRGININPSMVLYRTFGSGATFDISSGLNLIKVTDGQTAKGSKIIPLNGLVVNDLYKLTLKGLLSTSTIGNMEFVIRFGLNITCLFSFINTVMANEGFEFSCELTVRDAGSGNFGVDIGLGKLERNNFTTRIVFATAGVNIPNSAASLDIFMKPTVNLSTGSVTIYNYTIENI